MVVVDSASTDDRTAATGREAGAELVRCSVPGTSRARNAGLAGVDEELVAFTDDDCLVSPDWTTALVAAFAEDAGAAFVTGQVRADADVHRRAWLAVSLTTDARPRRLGPGDDPSTFGHGANMAWRRRELERIGGFDESMGPATSLRAGEDVDAWWRALRAGMTGFYTPEAVVVHRQWRSRRAALRSHYGYGVGAGALAVKRYRTAAVQGRAGARRQLLRGLVLDEGLGPVWRSVRQGHEIGAAANALMFLGGLEGARRAARLAVVDGRFTPDLDGQS